MNTMHALPGNRQDRYVDNYEKGGIFEWFIVRLFNRQNFHLQEWRRSRKLDSLDNLANYGDPDLQWELVFSGSKRYRFAVECKWRKEFRDGRIEWADQTKINRYIRFQRSTGISVFVAIGIGGQPGSPEKLFVTPLDRISGSCVVNEDQLTPYKRKPTRKFYYNPWQLWLF